MHRASEVARVGRWLMVAVALGAVLPSAGEAQLGGLKKLKQKVEKAVSDKPATKAASEDTPQQRSPYSENVLEIRADVADRLEKALAAENAELASFRAWASKVKTEDAYQACQTQIMMSPQAQAWSTEMAAAMEKGQAAAQKAMTTMAQKVDSLTEQTCGPRPNSVEEKRRQARNDAEEEAGKAGGFTGRQYFIIKERIPPICGTGALATADGALKLPGTGQDIFWVYSPAEVEVLRARCGRLQGALKQVL